MYDDGSPSVYHISQFVQMEETLEQYLSCMSQDGEWASHIELVALANMLGVTILMEYTMNTSKYGSIHRSFKQIKLFYWDSYFIALLQPSR